MKEVVFSLVIFVVLYLFYFFTVILKKSKLDKFMKGTEVLYLKKRYNLTLNNIKPKVLANVIALTNSLIISITLLIVVLIDNYILKLFVAFIILVPSIILCYHIIGTCLKKREG